MSRFAQLLIFTTICLSTLTSSMPVDDYGARRSVEVKEARDDTDSFSSLHVGLLAYRHESTARVDGVGRLETSGDTANSALTDDEDKENGAPNDTNIDAGLAIREVDQLGEIDAQSLKGKAPTKAPPKPPPKPASPPKVAPKPAPVTTKPVTTKAAPPPTTTAAVTTKTTPVVTKSTATTTSKTTAQVSTSTSAQGIKTTTPVTTKSTTSTKAAPLTTSTAAITTKTTSVVTKSSTTSSLKVSTSTSAKGIKVSSSAAPAIVSSSSSASTLKTTSTSSKGSSSAVIFTSVTTSLSASAFLSANTSTTVIASHSTSAISFTSEAVLTSSTALSNPTITSTSVIASEPTSAITSVSNSSTAFISSIAIESTSVVASTSDAITTSVIVSTSTIASTSAIVSTSAIASASAVPSACSLPFTNTTSTSITKKSSIRRKLKSLFIRDSQEFVGFHGTNSVTATLWEQTGFLVKPKKQSGLFDFLGEPTSDGRAGGQEDIGPGVYVTDDLFTAQNFAATNSAVNKGTTATVCAIFARSSDNWRVAIQKAFIPQNLVDDSSDADVRAKLENARLDYIKKVVPGILSPQVVVKFALLDTDRKTGQLVIPAAVTSQFSAQCFDAKAPALPADTSVFPDFSYNGDTLRNDWNIVAENTGECTAATA